MKKLRILTLMLFVCLVSIAWSQDKEKFEFTAFDAPGAGMQPGQGTVGYVIGRGDWITGTYADSNGAAHSFLRAPDGTIADFDPPGAQLSTTTGINVKLAITGWYVDQDGAQRAYIRREDGSFTTFAARSTSNGPAMAACAASINAWGEVSVWLYDENTALHGLIREPDGVLTEFDVPGAGKGAWQGTFVDGATGLTDAGTISGYWADGYSVWHGFIRSPDGKITEFDAPHAGTGAGEGTLAGSINQGDWISGWYIDGSDVSHGFLRAPDGKITEFDAPGAGKGPGQGTVAMTNNDAGEIVAYYVDANNVNHGFLRAPDGEITEFDAPGAGSGLPLGYGLSNSFAPGQGTVGVTLNNAGAVTGFYVDENSLSHGFLLRRRDYRR